MKRGYSVQRLKKTQERVETKKRKSTQNSQGQAIEKQQLKNRFDESEVDNNELDECGSLHSDTYEASSNVDVPSKRYFTSNQLWLAIAVIVPVVACLLLYFKYQLHQDAENVYYFIGEAAGRCSGNMFPINDAAECRHAIEQIGLEFSGGEHKAYTKEYIGGCSYDSEMLMIRFNSNSKGRPKRDMGRPICKSTRVVVQAGFNRTSFIDWIDSSLLLPPSEKKESDIAIKLPSLPPSSKPSLAKLSTSYSSSSEDHIAVVEETCSELKEKFAGIPTWEKNAIRRELQKFRPACFEFLFDKFRKTALKRIEMKQFNLHIPKAGGTSFCALMHETEVRKLAQNNCWIEPLCPYWCCCEGGSYASCEELEKIEYGFMMNERWMDYYGERPFCSDLFYSMIVRDPLNRTKSHVNHLVSSKHYKSRLTIERLNIIENNYISWSLLAGTSDDPTKYSASMGDLRAAKEVLTGFDIVIDMSRESCNERFFYLMGMGSDQTIPHKNVKQSNYADSFTEAELERMRAQNAIDIQLHEFALELVDLDCQFYERIAGT